MDLLRKFEQEEIQKLSKEIPAFKAGDTVTVGVLIQEGETQRTQKFSGVVLARKNAGINSSFIVRKITAGIAIEKNFKLYSPGVVSITVEKHGIVRRAKLYYLRKLSGKAAKIKEDKYYYQKQASAESK